MNRYDQSPSSFELTLYGSFDAAEVDKRREDLDYLSQTQHGCIVLGFQGVSFIDASGIGAIVYLYKRLRARGRTLQLTGVQGQPLELLRMLRIDRTLPIEPLVPAMAVLQEN